LARAHGVEDPQLVLHIHEGFAVHPLQVGLDGVSEGQREGHEHHAARHQPERGHVQHLVVGIAAEEMRQRIGDDRQVEADIGAVEGKVAMGGGDLGAVAVVVHAVQRVQEAPDAGAEEGERGTAERPQESRLVRMVAAALPDHDESEGHHCEEGRDFQAGEDRADPLPVARRADPVVVVARAEDSREQRQGGDDVKPFLHDLAVDAGELQHQEGEDRGHHQFPGAFDPEMDDVPPVHLVQRQVVGVHEGEEEQKREAPQAEQQDVGYGGLLVYQHCHRDVVKEDQRRDDDA
jgi:hypothetical protein